MIQQDTAAEIQMMTKKHHKGKETEDGRGMCILWPNRRGLSEDSIHTRHRTGPKDSRDQGHVRSNHRADCPQTTTAEDTWKDRRRCISDKTAMMVVGGRRDDSSGQKEKKIILIPTVQCQKIHREAQGWEGTGPVR